MTGCPICAETGERCAHRLGAYRMPPVVHADDALTTLGFALEVDFPSAQDWPRFWVTGGTLLSTNAYVARYGDESLVGVLAA